MKKARVIIWVVCVLAFIFLLVAYLQIHYGKIPFPAIQTTSVKTVYSAICIKCLQHAYINEKGVPGKAVQTGIRFYESHGGVLSTDIFARETPFLDARIYEEIHGAKCKHIFSKLSFGRSETRIFEHIESDGIVDSPYVDRVNVIGAIYELYSRTKNRELALSSYKIVDELYPVEKDKLYLSKQDSKRIASEMIDKFNSVTTEREWRDLINYLDEEYVKEKRKSESVFDSPTTTSAPHK